ncbi:MAG TPA: hypothetical protein VF712_18690 [Thermoleophilaceae bacterium]
MAPEADELGPADSHDALELALYRARRHAEVLGYLGPAAVARVERGNVTLALGEPVDHRARDSRQLLLILPFDQLLDRAICRIWDRLERPERVAGWDLEARTSEHVAELAVRGRAQPGKDLTLRLSATPILGEEAGLLEGVIDLLARGGRMPGGDLGA